MLKEENDLIRSAVDALLHLASQYHRGQVMPYDRIEAAGGVDRKHESWNTVVKKFRRRLLKEREIALRPVVNIGYELLTHRDQVRRCSSDRQRRMFRQAQKAIAEVGSVPSDSLGDHDRRLQMAQMDRLRNERKELRRSLREVENVKKSETIPAIASK